MTVSAVLMAVSGLALTFFPADLLKYTGTDPNGLLLLILQILGGLYFAFAMLNWTAKSNLIGGIYSRPVAIANFTHFLIGGLALLKECLWSKTHYLLVLLLLFMLCLL
ncbi:MAG: hypothetical protein IPK98_05060 [Chloracidobacterium sp.]|nr:hypothetical protein [Chloracidobacterium sp.]